MEKVNFEKEWEFIVAEIHNKKPNRKNLIKRETLFVMQIFLSNREFNSYYSLRKIYCKN